MMNVDYINPFIAATIEAISVMTFITPERGNPFLKKDATAQGDISGIIGFAGEAKGSIALTFPESLALKLYSQMVGETARSMDDMVRDSIGELANMVAGGAKAALAQKGFHFKIAIPSIVVGKNHSIQHGAAAPFLVVPFSAESETFWLEVSFTPTNASG